jgi:hypothetical protein
MLMQIVDPVLFEECLKAIKLAYYPYEEIAEYKTHIETQLPHWDDPPSDSQKIKKIRDNLNSAVDAIANDSQQQKLYQVIGIDYQGKAKIEEPLYLPFLNHFHKWFLVREWDEPYRDPKLEVDNLVRLHPRSATETIQDKNKRDDYSKYAKNYNHFVNVVAALARLICYFKDPQNVRNVLGENTDIDTCETIAYGGKGGSQIDVPNFRTFKLMLAAFYHDIGKTIVSPRHAMEGAGILASQPSNWKQFNKIVNAYRKGRKPLSLSNDEIFDSEDLLFVADLVLYHDQYGTLSTGEDGYLQLVEILDKINRYSLKHGTERAIWSKRYLFDLWLLNIADIMTSMSQKLESQSDWWEKSETTAIQKIENFFFNEEKEKANCLVHDLKISLSLLEKHFCKKHIGDLTSIEEDAHQISAHHVIERLRRLIVASIHRALVNLLNDRDKQYKIFSNSFGNLLQGFPEEFWDSVIVRSIESVADRNDFCSRLSWIGKSDYALGFFIKIAEGSLRQSEEKFSNDGVSDNDIVQDEAQQFANDYAAIVIQILGHLVFRERSITSLKNFEFSDAEKRLIDEKVKEILQGLSRSRRATYLILQTIYLY